MRLNFGREGFIFFSFYRFQKIYPDNTIIEFPVILNQHKRKQKKRFPVKLIRFGKPRDFLDYLLKLDEQYLIDDYLSSFLLYFPLGLPTLFIFFHARLHYIFYINFSNI